MTNLPRQRRTRAAPCCCAAAQCFKRLIGVFPGAARASSAACCQGVSGAHLCKQKSPECCTRVTWVCWLQAPSDVPMDSTTACWLTRSCTCPACYPPSWASSSSAAVSSHAASCACATTLWTALSPPGGQVRPRTPRPALRRRSELLLKQVVARRVIQVTGLEVLGHNLPLSEAFLREAVPYAAGRGALCRAHGRRHRAYHFAGPSSARCRRARPSRSPGSLPARLWTPASRYSRRSSATCAST